MTAEIRQLLQSSRTRWWEEEFDPLIAVGEDGVLYMSVGLVDLEEDEPSLVDHPLFFCPFCGTKLQTAEEVDAKSAAMPARRAEVSDATKTKDFDPWQAPSSSSW